MRLSKIIKEKAKTLANELKKVHTGAVNTLIANVSTEETDIRIVCHDARLNLAIGISPILAQLRREWSNEHNRCRTQDLIERPGQIGQRIEMVVSSTAIRPGSR